MADIDGSDDEAEGLGDSMTTIQQRHSERITDIILGLVNGISLAFFTYRLMAKLSSLEDVCLGRAPDPDLISWTTVFVPLKVILIGRVVFDATNTAFAMCRAPTGRPARENGCAIRANDMFKNALTIICAVISIVVIPSVADVLDTLGDGPGCASSDAYADVSQLVPCAVGLVAAYFIVFDAAIGVFCYDEVRPVEERYEAV